MAQRLTAAVEVPASCSRTAPSRVPSDPWFQTRHELAPPRASAIRLCRYSGVNDHPRPTLIRSVVRTAPSLVDELVREFDKLPPDDRTASCPADDGSRIVAHLAYPDGHAVTISVGLRGCESVTNGSVYRTAGGASSLPTVGPQLVAQLRRLTAVPTPSPSWFQTVRPPMPRVSTLGVTRDATLWGYCWSQARAEGGGVGVCADGAPGSPAHTLRWRFGTAVIIDLRLPAHDVRIDVARIGGFGRPPHDVIHLRAHHVDRTRWLVVLPEAAAHGTDLLISATFANGDLSADLGLEQRPRPM
jgi:hypothetical protein